MRTLLLVVFLGISSFVNAQQFPSRPVKLVVGFTPGGGVDIAARTLAPKLSELIGQPVIVDNKPGAGTNIANEFVARSAPDGTTLLVTTSALAINMALYRKLSFDALRDFTALSIFSESPNILVVNSKLPAANLKEFLALARATPGKLNYSSAGSGTTQHLSAELLKLKTGISITHIPYKGTAPSLTSLIASETDLTFANIPAILQHVKSGRLRPLASTGTKRAELMPEVPTMREAGVNGVEVTVWYGVLAPAGLPREMAAALSTAVAKAAHDPEMRKRLAEQGAEPVGNSADEFAKILRDEVAKWAEVVQVSGAKAD
jgi:tripartite-type tricarboxylate transporter receptor subunit TctC